MSGKERQSFLGPRSEKDLQAIKLGIIGLGGGGSHIAQQAAHLGVGNYILVDPDEIEGSNLNRLVGGTLADVQLRSKKVEIAERLIRGVMPGANILSFAKPWQQVAKELRSCDVIIGGLDSVTSKDDLDRFCRRFLVPYIDMGMDVHEVAGRYLIAGQVILITPGTPCLRCLGVVTEDSIVREAKNYGAAGGKPQVVWPNGVLASTAIGLFTQLVCPWHEAAPTGAYLEYDGNKHTVKPNQAYALLSQKPCQHHQQNEVGDALFDVRNRTEEWPNASPLVSSIKWWKCWLVRLATLKSHFRTVRTKRS